MPDQAINGKLGDRTYLVVKNVAGTTIEKGMGVSFEGAAASIDGIGVSLLLIAGIAGFAGIADEDIPNNAFGRVINSGVADSVLISHVGTSITITKGNILKPSTVAGTFFSSITPQAVSTLLYRYVQAMTTPVAISTKAQSYCKGWVVT